MNGLIWTVCSQLSHTIGPLLIMIGCVIYLVRGGGIEGVIALLGMLGTVLLTLATTVMIVLQVKNVIEPEDFGRFMLPMQIGYLLASLTFAFGFLGIACRTRNRRNDNLQGMNSVPDWGQQSQG